MSLQSEYHAHLRSFFALSLNYASFRLFLLTASVPNNFFRFAFYIFVSLQVKQNSTRHPVLLGEFIHQLEVSCRVANPNQSKSIFSSYSGDRGAGGREAREGEELKST